MEIEGKIKQLLPEQNGEGRNGPWRKQEFILETLNDKYPKQICISTWGDVIDELKSHQVNSQIRAYIDISSREYNGRWYTDVKAWRIDAMQSEQGAAPSSSEPPAGAPMPSAPSNNSNDIEEDDLPF